MSAHSHTDIVASAYRTPQLMSIDSAWMVRHAAMSASPPHFVHGSLTHSLDRLRPHPVGVRVDDTTADMRGVCNWGAFWQVTQGQVQTGQGCGVKTISNTPTGTTSEPALARQYC